MKQSSILNLTISKTELTELIEVVFGAAQQVGRRDFRRVNVYASMVEGVTKFTTTVGSNVPGFYSILIASARWSVSRMEYVISTNDFLSCHEVVEVEHRGKTRKFQVLDMIVDALDRGLSCGIEEFKAADEINQKIATLKDRILIQVHSSLGGSAYFMEREDAELWAITEVGNKVVDWTVTEITPATGLEAEVAEKLGLDKLWVAFVASTGKA